MSLGTKYTTFNFDIIEQCSVTKEWDGFGKSQTMLVHFFSMEQLRAALL